MDADIKHVGITAAGAMGVPKNPLSTGWYELGPRPGEVGNAIIAGHLNWLYGATGAFVDLYQLKPGDRIMTQDDQGVITFFVVRETRKFKAKDKATDVFISTDGKAHLNLITCDGVWDKTTKQYSNRLVVFADKVEG